MSFLLMFILVSTSYVLTTTNIINLSISDLHHMVTFGNLRIINYIQIKSTGFHVQLRSYLMHDEVIYSYGIILQFNR